MWLAMWHFVGISWFLLLMKFYIYVRIRMFLMLFAALVIVLF